MGWLHSSLVSVLISLAWSILSASGSPGKWNVVTVVDLVASVVVVFPSVVRLGAVLLPAVSFHVAS